MYYQNECDYENFVSINNLYTRDPKSLVTCNNSYTTGYKVNGVTQFSALCIPSGVGVACGLPTLRVKVVKKTRGSCSTREVTYLSR